MRTIKETLGPTHYFLIDWYSTEADLWLEKGDAKQALKSLDRGLQLLKSHWPNLKIKRSDLERRKAAINPSHDEAILQLRRLESELEPRLDVGYAEKARVAEDLAEAYRKMRDPTRALEWSRVALARRKRSSIGPTIELANAQARHSMDLAGTGSWLEAFEVSNDSVDTLLELSRRETLGCRAGQDANPDFVGIIREWGAVLSALMLSSAVPPQEVAPTDVVVKQFFKLVQTRETDLYGIAALRSAMRNRLVQTEDVRRYIEIAETRCALEQSFALKASERPLNRSALGDLDHCDQ